MRVTKARRSDGYSGSGKDLKQPTTGRLVTFDWRKGEGLEVFTALPILDMGKISRPGVGGRRRRQREAPANFYSSEKTRCVLILWFEIAPLV